MEDCLFVEELDILGWPKSSFGFSLRCYGKTQRNFFGQPNIIFMYICHGVAELLLLMIQTLFQSLCPLKKTGSGPVIWFGCPSDRHSFMCQRLLDNLYCSSYCNNHFLACCNFNGIIHYCIFSHLAFDS